MKNKALLYSIIAALALVGGYLVYYSQQKIEKPASGPDKEYVLVETNAGDFVAELNPAKAPKSVANFYQYVDSGFYQNTIFHRVIAGFVVQGGGFENGMQQKPTLPPVEDESANGLSNKKGSIAMARRQDPNSATSQFYINLNDNFQLDARGGNPGYTVFGDVFSGLDIIEKIARARTKTMGPFQNVPATDFVIKNVSRIDLATAMTIKQQHDEVLKKEADQPFIAGKHYVELTSPVPTSDNNKIEVVEAFAFGCGHCYGAEPVVTEWLARQPADVDFKRFPAVWNEPMKLYARTFYTAQKLGIEEQAHMALFDAIVAKQMRLSNKDELADFFRNFEIANIEFIAAFDSAEVSAATLEAEVLTKHYNLGSVPEVIVNGRYRVDPARAGGIEQMFEVVDYLVNKERKARMK